VPTSPSGRGHLAVGDPDYTGGARTGFRRLANYTGRFVEVWCSLSGSIPSRSEIVAVKSSIEKTCGPWSCPAAAFTSGVRPNSPETTTNVELSGLSSGLWPHGRGPRRALKGY